MTGHFHIRLAAALEDLIDEFHDASIVLLVDSEEAEAPVGVSNVTEVTARKIMSMAKVQELVA